MESYLEEVRNCLNRAVCIRTFPCQDVERHSKAEVEYQTSPELLACPMSIERSHTEKVLIEQSINSVRISIKVHIVMAFLSREANSQIIHLYMRLL